MSSWKLKLYHQSPAFLRNWIASARGYYLQSWRYSAATDDLIAKAQQRENWSAKQWSDYQEEHIAFILRRAVTKVPYYRELWAQRRRNGNRSSFEYLENWPILEKEPLRKNPRAFVADDCNSKDMFHEHTSGTTGKSLDLWWSRATVRAWYALFEARWRHWYGVSRYDRWTILGGQLITPINQKHPPFWVWNQGMRQLYMSSYHLSPAFMPHYIEALTRYRIDYIYSYTSSVYALAKEILSGNYNELPRLKVVITNAEPLYKYQREVIEQAFQCPVRETYGMSEIVTAAGECEYGNLHLWPEVGYVELAERDKIDKSITDGELICTGLLNTDMPLIRYRVGDRVRLMNEDIKCNCGRSLPLIQSVEGRQDDLLYAPDGRRIGRLDPVFKTSLPVKEAQIIQDKINLVRVRYVPDSNYTTADGESIIERLQARLGSDVQVQLEPVSKIPRTSNGKFRAVICNLSQVERDSIISS